ncbi:MAG TPA: cytochrome P450 [Actinophytocola sp.]|uniref:cytochrome P450 n=1 Tax=Actinophytocola sp. TaxID=1872138 RepID=UPI002DBCD7C7|nr:cytochrome P450 [Actinophytocola sp.]HEU5469376.1 cytochrome P450 [Actinophytocola sp.]
MRIRLAVRYSDVAAVLTDDRFSRAAAAGLPGVGFGRNQYTGLLDLDPPAHATLRAPLDRALSAERVRAWEPRLRAAVRDVLGEFAGANPQGGPADFVAGFAAPLAARTTAELVGLGTDAAGWLAANVDDMLDNGSAEARSALEKGLAELVAARAADGADDSADDIVSTLLDSGLGEEDARTVLFGLLMSGYIGNRNALSRHVFALLALPGAEGMLHSLSEPYAASVVEELLRHYPSGNDGLLRVVRETVVLSGERLDPGTVVMPLVAAASFDPEVFDRPERFDPDRTPNPHLSLGAGTHGCPGDHLVRTLFRIALVELAGTLPGLALAVAAGEVAHTADLLPMGVVSLPVTW